MNRFLCAVLISLCSIVLSTICVSAQTLSTKGTEFYFAYMQNSDLPEMWVFVSADATTTAQVFIGPTLLTTLNVPGGGAASFRLPAAVANAAHQTTSDVIRPNSAIRVTSGLPVTVYAFNTLSTSTDACIVLPKVVLADEYVVASSKFYQQAQWKPEIAIVGVEPSVVVEITPTAQVFTTGGGPGHAPGVAYTITLAQGAVYQIQSNVINADLTGTRIRVITNSGPCGSVAVFSGHQRTALPNTSNNSRDHLVEQIPPTRTLGKNFVVPPIQTSTQYMVRVVASEINTQVTVGATTTTLPAIGSFVEQSVGGTLPIRVTSNKPVLVAQYALSRGNGFGPSAPGDPFMMLVPPVEQRIDRFTFNAFVPPLSPASAQVEWRNNMYVNIIARTVDLDAIEFDGVPISVLRTRATAPRVLSANSVGSGLSYAIVHVREGVHVVNASAGDGAIGLIYALASVDSYGFAGGTSVSNLRAFAQIVDTLACPGRPTLLEAFSLDSAAISTYQWMFPFDGSTQTGKRITKSFPDTGSYRVLLNLLKGGCTLDTIETVLTIETPVKISFALNRSPECWNTPVRITAKATGGVGPYTYAWEFISQNGIVSGLNDSTLVVSHAVGGTYRYRVNITDQQGCLARKEVEVVIRNGPAIDQAPDVLVCRDDTATVTALVQNAATNQYLWSGVTPADDSAIVGSRIAQEVRVAPLLPGFYNYNVRVTDINGCFNNGRYRVEVVDKPRLVNNGQNPIIQCLEDTVPPITIGDSIVIAGGQAPYTFQWREEGGGTTTITGSTTTQITTVKPPFTTSYILTVRGSDNRVDCPVTIRVTVEVRLVPDANAGDDKVICMCTNVDGVDIGENALCGRAPYSYSWTPTTGLSNPTSTVTAVTRANPATTTTYVITAQDADGGSNQDTVVVFVEPCPEVTIPDVTICQEANSAQLEPVVTVVDPETATYRWTPTTNLSDATIRNPVVLAENNTYEATYTLEVMSDKGCVKSATVRVRRSFDLRAIVSATPECATDTICRGDTVMLAVEGLGGQAPYSYSWTANPPDNTIVENADGTARATPLVTTVYTATVNDGFGCNATNIVQVCVDPVPNAFAGADTIVCASDAGVVPIFRGSPSTCGKAPFIYEWTPSANVIIPDQANAWRADLRPTTTTTFLLKVTDDGGNGNSTTDTVVVTVRPPIDIAFVPDTIDLCKGIATDPIAATASAGNPPYQFTWAVDGVDVITDITSSSTLFPAALLAAMQQTSMIRLIVVDSLGCVGIDSIIAVIRNAPVVTPEPLFSICPCDSVQIGALATGGTPFTDGSYRYKWTEVTENQTSRSSISNDTLARPFVSPRRTTTYVVVATDSAGCVSEGASVTVEVDIPGDGTVIRSNDVVADPHVRKTPVPIRITSGQETINCPPEGFVFDISYDERLYDPHPDLSAGNITSNTVSMIGDVPVRTLRISIIPAPMLTANSTVTTLNGAALLGAPGSTSMVISNAKMVWSCDSVSLSSEPGMLTLDSLCLRPDGSPRLLSYEVGQIQDIFPNPTEGGITVMVLRQGIASAELIIVNEIGEAVFTANVPPSPSKEQSSISIPVMLNVSSGTYKAVLKYPAGVSVQSFMVIK